MTSKYQQAGLGELFIASGAAARVDDGQAIAAALSELEIASGRKELVFIEDNVPDIDTLIRGFGAGKEVVILDAARDGLQQIVAALEGRSGVDALHIVSHGAAGVLNLGQLTLDAANLNVHEEELQTIGASLAPGADILLYGCGIGGGEGAGFVEQLAIATGADVAASDDLTGGLAAGGDWELEVAHGDIETHVAIDPALAAMYAGVLNLTPSGPVNFNNPDNFYDRGYDSGDIIYLVDNNPAYRLIIDGKYNAAYSPENSNFPVGTYGYAVIATADDFSEKEASIFFEGGDKMFTISGMDGSVLNTNTPNNRDQTLTVTGLKADGTTVKTDWVVLGDVAGQYPYSWYSPDDLSQFTNIVRLTITATSEGDGFQYLAIDNLNITNIRPVENTPTTPTVTITSAATGTMKAGDTSVISFTFNVKPQDFDRSDVDVTGGTLGELTASQDGKTYTGVFTPAALTNNGSASITVDDGAYQGGDGTPGTGGYSPIILFDTLAPAKPAQPALQAASDTGVVGDNITSDSTPTFSGGVGSVEGLATVRVYAGATLIGETTANADGSWSATSSMLASASHQVTIVASDSAGNASIASDPLILVIDTSAPGAPTLPVLATGSDSGVKNDNITNAVTQTIGGAAGSAEGGSVITLYSGGVAIPGASTTADLDGSWSIDLTLAHGSYSIAARATDKAGNTGGASPVLTLTVDRVAPGQPQAPLLHADSNSGSKTDTITNDRTPAFYGVAGSVEGGATVNLYADGDFIGTTAATANGSWSLEVNQLGSGTYAITAEVVDVAGNVSVASSSTSVTIDFTPPSAQVDGVKFSDDTGARADDFVTNKAGQVVSGILTAPLAQGEWVGVSIDNGASYASAGIDGDGVAWSLPGVQIMGKGTLVVRVFDAAGNAGEAFSHAYEYDAAAPGKPSAPNLTEASDSGDDDQDDITGVTMPTFTGTAEKDATITLYADGNVVGSGKADTDGNWSVTVDEALEGGNYDFTVRATDLAGNQGDASDALAVTIITAAPGTENLTFTLSADSGIGGDRITNVADQILQGTLSAALASGEKVQVYLGGKWLDAEAVAGDTTWSLDATLKEGEHEVEVRVVNAIGNAGPVGKYAYTLDTEAPTVEITSDKPKLKAGETATITFTFSEDPGAALSSEVITVTGGTLSAVSGSGLERTAVFTPSVNQNGGSASISIDAGLFTDLAGNDSESASLTSLTFDTLAPAAPSAPVLAVGSDTGAAGDGITANNRPTFTGTAESGATVILYDAQGNVIGTGTAVDGAWSIAPVAALGEGKHTISARAVDAAGNESAAATGGEITIDFTPPTLSITSDVAKLRIGETATITFTFSEEPTDFSADSIDVSGGKLGTLTKDGLTFTATFTPDENVDTTTASITVGAGAYVDVAGNNGAPGLSPTLVFDTKAPVAPSIPDLVAESDTGSEDDDDITGDTTPTFSGTAEAGATVTLFAGDREIGSVVATDGAWRITSDVVLVQGEYEITAVATDAAGNAGPASQPLKIEIVTDAPTTKATSLKFSADTGASQTDLVTRTAAQTISGALDAELNAGEYVEVSVDGGKHWNRASIDAEGWSIATTLLEGEDSVAVRVVNAIGNPGEEYTRDYRLDTLAPGVTITSNVSAVKRGESATITFTFSEDPGATFTWNGAAGDVVVSGGALSAISGSGTTRTATFTPADGFEGNASITVAASSYADLAGNLGTNGVTPALSIDTKAPDAPEVPKLAADSDTGEKGDGRTESTTQVIEGSGAEPGAMVYLYNGNLQIGSGQANAEGLWSIDVALGRGTHALSVTQFDAAGNESAKSDPFQLTVTVSNPNPNPNPDPDPEPNPQPNPPAVIDGMPVTTTPVTLPGGVRGTTVAVPIVTGARNETDGQASLADIPLASSGGQTQLLAQLPVGYGLSTSGASVGAASGLEFLIASIRAATPTHAPDDQGHLVQNGTSFLQGLSYSSLLVHTVKPISNPGTTDALVLTGSNPGGAQGTALVIETAGLANDATLELVDIDFAALIGAATVYTGSNGAILAGDGASQHFTVLAGGNNGVFAGGGSDLLTFAAAAPVDPGSANGRASAQQVAAGGVTTLHGGQGGDAASFAGARADYDVDVHNGYLVVSSKAAPDAKALVVNVEELRFGDGNVVVENGAGLTTLAGMYQTVFGRQADLYGFEYWADHRDNGMSWGTIALELIASSERVAQHGDFNGDTANDIGLLYQALFNREAEAEGLAFWKAAMDERGMTLEQVATSFVESAEMVGHQRGALDWDFLV